MTMGLLLQSSLDLGYYIYFSGRTLPEFSDYAILDISMTDLRENNILIIALTENEANKGFKENGNSITTLVSQITNKNLKNEELFKVEGLEIW